MRLLTELRRRNVVRMAGLYLVGAWLIVQVAETLLPVFGTPDWVLQTLVVLLAIGFIPALVFSWVFELTPDGLKRDADVAPGESIGPQTARRMDRLILAGLLALIALVAADRFWPAETGPESLSGAETAAGPKSDRPESDSGPVSAAASSAAPEKSIAVLAFTDLSPGKDQEYFSDGVSEEILNALVKVRGLRVAGRTSSFSFKGKDQDLRGIGRALGVAHVLEGSVRTQGDKVRVTAQLIRGEDGFHLWSETYDGELTDVFELQDQIARRIVRELDVVLQSGDSARMVEVATRSSEAYGLYLRATGVFNRREQARYPEALGWLEQAVRLDPDFARGYARLANLRAIAATGPEAPGPDAQEAIERDARRALELDPGLAEPHAALARAYAVQQPQRRLDSRDEMERAIALGADDADINFTYAQVLLNGGYVRLGTERLDRTLAIDPLLPNALFWRGTQYLAHDNFAAARQALERADDAGLSVAKAGLLELAHATGDYERARELLDAMPPQQSVPCGGVKVGDLPIDIRVGRPGTAAERAAAVALIDRCLASKPERIPFWVHQFLERLGEPERALAAMLAAPSDNEGALRWRIWMPAGAAVRALPGFAEYARQVGLIDVWEKYGPPDACRRIAPRDYVCG